MGRHLVEDIHVSFRRGFEMLVKKGEVHREQLHPKSRSAVDILQRDHRKLIELESRMASGDYDALVEFVERLMDHLNREEMLSVLWLLEDTGELQAKLGLLSSPMRDDHIH
ncbi:hypothetical protein DYB34_013361 [Aphanomyces astaci]|uniref:Hemerythrin-like domain-containing protein n=1 Tax=Aphanomyces astaci TaxID=112090 RepID=A0A3R7DQT8_APHAT|nr:hypothetical protein DYB34_013361 [Aphanomyces astaci]